MKGEAINSGSATTPPFQRMMGERAHMGNEAQLNKHSIDQDIIGMKQISQFMLTTNTHGAEAGGAVGGNKMQGTAQIQAGQREEGPVSQITFGVVKSLG